MKIVKVVAKRRAQFARVDLADDSLRLVLAHLLLLLLLLTCNCDWRRRSRGAGPANLLDHSFAVLRGQLLAHQLVAQLVDEALERLGSARLLLLLIGRWLHLLLLPQSHRHRDCGERLPRLLLLLLLLGPLELLESLPNLLFAHQFGRRLIWWAGRRVRGSALRRLLLGALFAQELGHRVDNLVQLAQLLRFALQLGRGRHFIVDALSALGGGGNRCLLLLLLPARQHPRPVLDGKLIGFGLEETRRQTAE